MNKFIVRLFCLYWQWCLHNAVKRWKVRPSRQPATRLFINGCKVQDVLPTLLSWLTKSGYKPTLEAGGYRTMLLPTRRKHLNCSLQKEVLAKAPMFNSATTGAMVRVYAYFTMRIRRQADDYQATANNTGVDPFYCFFRRRTAYYWFLYRYCCR